MDIIKLDELAEQAGLGYRRPDGRYWIDAGFIDVHLERFAKLVAAEEREACAGLCEDLFLSDGEWCAKSIRARNVSTKPQNIDTSTEHVHEIDKSVHEEIERLKAEIKRANKLADYRLKLLMQMPEPWDTSDMAHRAGGLNVEESIKDSNT